MASAMKIKSTKSPNGTETGSIVAVLSASSFWCQLKRREGQRQSPFFDSTGDLSYTGLIGTYPGWAELLIPPATLLCFTRVAMVSRSQGHKAHSAASIPCHGPLTARSYLPSAPTQTSLLIPNHSLQCAVVHNLRSHSPLPHASASCL